MSTRELQEPPSEGLDGPHGVVALESTHTYSTRNGAHPGSSPRVMECSLTAFVAWLEGREGVSSFWLDLAKSVLRA